MRGYELFRLDEDGAVRPEEDPLAWLDWMRTNPRLVNSTVLVNEREIVTLFAGYAGDKKNGRPCPFCTVVKPDPAMPEYALVLCWYATREEAEAGHAQEVSRFSDA